MKTITKRMKAIIPLLGTTAAAAAFAFLVYKKVSRDNILEEQYKQIRDHILEEQYKQIRDAAAKLSTSSKLPITVLVLGFQNHGRSSFVNTMCRVLYKEEGQLVMRAERKNKTTQTVLKVKNTLLRNPNYLMNVIDTPCFSTSEDIDENAIRNVLRGPDAGIEANESELSYPWNPSKQRDAQLAPDCVILVMKAGGSYMGGPASDRLPALARIIREEGLKFVVVLTHKKVAQKASIDLHVLTRGVALEAETDFVHCVENYVADRSDGKNDSNYVVSNDFDTHSQILSVVRECFEYAEERRQVKSARGAAFNEAVPATDGAPPALEKRRQVKSAFEKRRQVKSARGAAFNEAVPPTDGWLAGGLSRNGIWLAEQHPRNGLC